MMQETQFRLAPPRQVRVAGISLGVLAINPDAADRAALLGVVHPDTGQPRTHRVRPGDEVPVAGRTVLVGDVVPGRNGFVEVTVRWPEDLS
jgi:hypothetical protein